MAEQAQITSVEAIESFRANLILFLSQARPALEEVSSEVLRVRLWLQNDQRRFWENELRLRGRKLEEAQQELFTARLSEFQDTTSLQQMAVNRWQRSVREAEAKMTQLKKWDRELENRTAPLVKQVEQFHNFLTTEMPRAVAHLSQVVKTLEAYAGTPRPGASAAGGNSMSMVGNKGRLQGVTKELSLRWSETKNFWRDAKSEEFESRYLAELFAGTDKSVALIEKLDELLKKVRSDCE